ncbi:MAG: hypothetical protein EBQ92_00860, partial [Proteobacteria bacterium]|nr:hypothetical protein [Pseudomonadota bacterium]
MPLSECDINFLNHIPFDKWGLYLNLIYGYLWLFSGTKNIDRFDHDSIYGKLVRILFPASDENPLEELTLFNLGELIAYLFNDKNTNDTDNSEEGKNFFDG